MVRGFSSLFLVGLCPNNSPSIASLATQEFGYPSSLQGDQRGENIECALYMETFRRPDSYIWGA
jgi:hypothetical protein